MDDGIINDLNVCMADKRRKNEVVIHKITLRWFVILNAWILPLMYSFKRLELCRYFLMARFDAYVFEGY